jgi:hypothetical protein
MLANATLDASVSGIGVSVTVLVGEVGRGVVVIIPADGVGEGVAFCSRLQADRASRERKTIKRIWNLYFIFSSL